MDARAPHPGIIAMIDQRTLACSLQADSPADGLLRRVFAVRATVDAAATRHATKDARAAVVRVQAAPR